MDFCRNPILQERNPAMLSKSMLINEMRQEDSLTENGALTNSTSLSSCVDLFFLAGAARNLDEGTIHKKIAQSWGEDPATTLKIIFWAGDVRGGAGERKFFRTALKWLDQNQPKVLSQNIHAGNVEFYNRWDSLFELRNTEEEVMRHVEQGIEKGDGLLGKWAPRRHQYKGFAQRFMNYTGWTWPQYRKTIVKLSRTVEQLMSSKEWAKINYEQVPSVAMNKYRKAWYRNDKARFEAYIEAVTKGEAKIKAGAIFP